MKDRGREPGVGELRRRHSDVFIDARELGLFSFSRKGTSTWSEPTGKGCFGRREEGGKRISQRKIWKRKDEENDFGPGRELGRWIKLTESISPFHRPYEEV